MLIRISLYTSPRDLTFLSFLIRTLPTSSSAPTLLCSSRTLDIFFCIFQISSSKNSGIKILIGMAYKKRRARSIHVCGRLKKSRNLKVDNPAVGYFFIFYFLQSTYFSVILDNINQQQRTENKGPSSLLLLLYTLARSLAVKLHNSPTNPDKNRF